MKKQTTIFITGAEGVGKSTLKKGLQKKYSEMKVYDFDEVGVPLNPPLEWRINTTKYWIKKAIKNQVEEISTIIVGLSFPEEIKKCEGYQKLKSVIFIFLDVSKKERERRLKERKAAEEVIKDTHCFFELKKQFRHMKEKIIDTSNLNPEEVLKQTTKIFEENKKW